VEWVSLGVGAAAIAVIIKIFVFQAFVIPSASMYPTLKINDRVLVNKLSYKFNDPERGDIVVFDAPPGEKSDQIQDLVKRVVGLPGEVLQEVNGTVYINNHKLDEPYLKMPHTKNYKACRVPADTYFMMGDNRDQSKDSTYFGPIKSSTIVGRAFIKIWPLNKIEFFSAGPKLEANASGPLDANGVNTATATTNTTTVTTTPPVTTPATAVLQPCGPSNGGG
jgi:signal peptidase I